MAPDIGSNASDATATAFVSYCRQDADIALRLARDLKAGGASVWLDQLDIVPGQRWDRAVEQALKMCRRMLVVLTPASVESTNVMDEVSFALEEQKVVIPVVHQECAIPFRLRRLQRVDLIQGYEQGLRELLRVLSSVQPASPVPRATMAPESVSSVEPSVAPLAAQTVAAATEARSNPPLLVDGVDRRQLPTLFSSDDAHMASMPAVRRALNETQGFPIGVILFAIPAAWLVGQFVSLALVGLSFTPFVVIGTAGGTVCSLLIAAFGVSMKESAPFIRFGQLLRISVWFLLAGLFGGFVGLALWLFGCPSEGAFDLQQSIGCRDTSRLLWKLGAGLSSALGLAGASTLAAIEFSLTRLGLKGRGGRRVGSGGRER